MSYQLKNPQARVDYQIDWGSSYLDERTIAASQWTVSPDETGGIEVDEDSFDLQRTTVTVTGGVPGHLYRVGNRVTLSDGRSDERSLSLRVEQR